jgi:hypothetical protein
MTDRCRIETSLADVRLAALAIVAIGRTEEGSDADGRQQNGPVAYGDGSSKVVFIS